MPGNAIRICAVGDSFIAGYGDEACQGWTGRCAAALAARGWDITLYPLGIRRNTSADVRERLLSEVERRLPAGAPGGVLLGFGANDCIHEHGRPRVARQDSLAHLRAILASVRPRWPTLVVGPPPFTLPAQPGLVDDLRALTAGYADLCGAAGVPFLPLVDVLAHDPLWDASLARGDHVHPDGPGYARVAAIVAASPSWQAWLDDASTRRG